MCACSELIVRGPSGCLFEPQASSSSSPEFSQAAGSSRNAGYPPYWTLSLALGESIGVTVRHNVNKLRNQETFNLGQIHLVRRVIYQNANTLSTYGRARLLELIYMPIED